MFFTIISEVSFHINVPRIEVAVKIITVGNKIPRIISNFSASDGVYNWRTNWISIEIKHYFQLLRNIFMSWINSDITKW